VRRADPDRFLTALFAPPRLRETLLLLYAFNHELARANEVASEPTLALIRLQWWREVIAGARRRHEVAGPLLAAIEAGRLPAAALAALVDAREAETAEFATLADWLDHVRATAGALAVVAGRLLGADAASLARLAGLGTAYGIVGHARNVAVLARHGRCRLPRELLARHGLTAAAVVARPQASLPPSLCADLARLARGLLREHGGPLGRPVLAAALPAVLARRDLARLDPARPDLARLAHTARPRGLGDKLAVLAAYLLGRV
jgi:phytoene synthase